MRRRRTAELDSRPEWVELSCSDGPPLPPFPWSAVALVGIVRARPVHHLFGPCTTVDQAGRAVVARRRDP